MATNKLLIDEVNRFTVSELKVSYYPKMRAFDRAMITRSSDAYPLFLNNWDLDAIYMVEHSHLMLLNRTNRVLGIIPLSVGGVSCTIVDPKVVFRYAIAGGATAIMIAHNHPTCILTPSKNDEMMTSKIREGGKLLDIHLMDHLIISPEGYLSMADEGFL